MNGSVVYLNSPDDIVEIPFADCDKITSEVKARMGKWSRRYTAGDIRSIATYLVDEYINDYCLSTWATFIEDMIDESYDPKDVVNYIMDNIQVIIQ